MVSIAKVLLGVFGVAVVVILIAVPTAIFLNEEEEVLDQRRTFTLEDAFNSSLKPRSYNLRWISDHEYLHQSQGSVYLYNLLTNHSVEFLKADLFDRTAAQDYQLSADRQYAAFVSNYTKLWRHSFTASYWLYNITSQTFIASSDIPHQVQYFAWAPEGHKMAYVWRNNVYVKLSPTSPYRQVTFNGEYNRIFNGHPDWVYEEEMFGSNQGLWWSPGGKFVAYAQFNDTQVHTIEYSWYGNDQYPSTVSIPYPKPGTPNPVVKLFVVNTAEPFETVEAVVPGPFASVDHYLATVTWATDDRLAVQWLKRQQNHLILQMYNLTETACVPAEHQVVQSQSGWIGRFSPPDPVFAADRRSYYLLMSDGRGYKHIHQVSGGAATAITSGEWEVLDVLKVTADAVYYSSNQEGGRPGGKNVYRWTEDGTTCLTCKLDENCHYNSAYFSHGASFYRLSCSGPGVPRHTLMDNRNDTVHKVLEENEVFAELISGVQMPSTVRDTITVAGFKLWYQMTLPPGFDKSKQYPLLIYVYAGPCSQQVTFAYSVGWSSYLASTEKVIVASFDGRGSGYQGDEIMHQIYRRLGTYEVEDQITAAREFIKMGFVDKDNVAIWGWSYGGYVTSMALGSGTGVFKCGMAVAPVSKWMYYDSIYTERYMLQPAENPGFYANTTVTARAKNFHSVKYLLIHGTADDNVHFQQAAEISEALVEEQVDFEAMWYTDKDHGLTGAAYEHVYTHMSHFLKRCFA